MKGFWGGLLLLVALTFMALPAQAGEVEDLQRAVQELKEEVAALRAERSLEASSVESAIDEYLSGQSAEGMGDVAGYLGGHFGLRSTEGAFKLNIGGGVAFDARFYEPDAAQTNTFDIDLVRLNINGQVGDGWSFKIQPEFSTDGAWLQDAYIQTRTSAVFGASGNEYIDGIAWTFGQFKQPFSLSKLTDDYAIDTIMRPMLVRALAPGRDIGIQLSNTIADGMFYWAVAIANGTNDVNDTNEFTYWARVVVTPWLNDEDSPVRNLHFGLSFGTQHSKESGTPGISGAGGGPYGYGCDYYDDGYDGYDSFYPEYAVRGREMLWGLELLWWLDQLAVKGEFMYLTQDIDGSEYYRYVMPTKVMDAPYDSDPGSEATTLGGYLAVNYMLTGEEWSETPDKGLELVGQVEYAEIDPGGSENEGDVLAFTLGANWYFSKNARAMLNWVATDYGDDTLRPSMEDGCWRSGGYEHVLLLRLQLPF